MSGERRQLTLAEIADRHETIRNEIPVSREHDLALAQLLIDVRDGVPVEPRKTVGQEIAQYASMGNREWTAKTIDAALAAQREKMLAWMEKEAANKHFLCDKGAIMDCVKSLRSMQFQD